MTPEDWTVVGFAVVGFALGCGLYKMGYARGWSRAMREARRIAWLAEKEDP